jgi:transposase
MDESTVGLIYPMLKCWMKKGQQKRLPMLTGKRQSQVLAGVLNWRTEQVSCRELLACNSEEVIGFFEWLFREIYPSETIVLVMDNASFHHSYAVQAALSLFEHRVLILWLPPYSPDLNPIERFWKHLKANACANYLYSSIEELLDNLRRVIDCHNEFDSDLHLSFSKDF